VEHLGSRIVLTWRDQCQGAVTAFKAAYDAKFPKGTAKITDDVDELLAFYDYPAEHWVRLRAINPMESMFATVASPQHSDQGSGFPRGVGWLWPPGSSKPPMHAGGRSTHHTWSLVCAPAAPSRAAYSSNNPAMPNDPAMFSNPAGPPPASGYRKPPTKSCRLQNLPPRVFDGSSRVVLAWLLMVGGGARG